MFRLANGTNYTVEGATVPVPPNHERQRQVAATRNSNEARVRVVTMNVSYQGGPQWESPRGGGGSQEATRMAILEDVLLRSEADIICLQESVTLRTPTLPAGGTQAVYIASKNRAQTHCPGHTLVYTRQSSVRVLAESTVRPLLLPGVPDPASGGECRTPPFPIVCLTVKDSPVVLVVCSVHLAPFAPSHRVREFQLNCVYESMRAFAFEVGVNWGRTLFCIAGDANMQSEEAPPPRLRLHDCWHLAALGKNQGRAEAGLIRPRDDDADDEDDVVGEGAAGSGQGGSAALRALAPEMLTMAMMPGGQQQQQQSQASAKRLLYSADHFSAEKSATFADSFNDFNSTGLCEMRLKYPHSKKCRYDRVWVFAEPEQQRAAQLLKELPTKSEGASSKAVAAAATAGSPRAPPNSAAAGAGAASPSASQRGGGGDEQQQEAVRPISLHVTHAQRFGDGRVVVHSGSGVIANPTRSCSVAGAVVCDQKGRMLSDHYGLLFDMSIAW